MKTTTVIFALSPEDARFAIKYQKQQTQESVKILAPDFPAQNTLRSHGYYPYDFFLEPYSQKDYYTTIIQKNEKKARQLTITALEKLSKEFPDDASYLWPLQNRLEMIYIELLDAYEYYLSITRLWEPEKYLLSESCVHPLKSIYSVYQPSISHARLIFTYFVAKPKQQTFSAKDHPSGIPDSLSFLKNHAGNPITWPSKIEVITQHIIDRMRYGLSSQDRKKPDIIFYSGGRNLLCYRRLFKILSAKKIPYLVLTYPQLLEEESMVRKNRIQFMPLTQFQTEDIKKISTDKTKKIILHLSIWFSRNTPDNLFGADENKIIQKAFFLRTKETIITYVGKNVNQTMVAARVFEELKPKLLITTHDPGPLAMPFALEAKKQKIPSIVLMHGWLDTILGVDYKSDLLTAWGPYISKWYKKKLYKPSKSVKSLGYPELDDLLLHRQAFWQKNNTVVKSPLTRLGLLLTMYIPNTFGESIFINDFFVSLARRANRYSVVIRSHPGQKTDGMHELARQHGIKITLNPSISLTEFITSSDVIIAWDTTALIWAMVFGKPLFYCTPNWDWGIMPIKQFGGAWLPRNAEHLFHQLERLESNISLLQALHKGQLRFLREVIGVLDGSSSDQHSKLMYDMLKKKM